MDWEALEKAAKRLDDSGLLERALGEDFSMEKARINFDMMSLYARIEVAKQLTRLADAAEKESNR